MSDAWMCGRGLRQHPRLRTLQQLRSLPSSQASMYWSGWTGLAWPE